MTRKDFLAAAGALFDQLELQRGAPDLPITPTYVPYVKSGEEILPPNLVAVVGMRFHKTPEHLELLSVARVDDATEDDGVTFPSRSAGQHLFKVFAASGLLSDVLNSPGVSADLGDDLHAKVQIFAQTLAMVSQRIAERVELRFVSPETPLPSET